MRFTQAAAYGISALVYLAGVPAGGLVSNSAICAAQQMPAKFVLQIMRVLVNAEIITSAQGREGGFQLAKPANKITLLEIIEAVDGRIGADEYVNLTGMAKGSQAKVEKALTAIDADVRQRLASITLASLRFAEAA